jgi:hypothetical protein
VLVTWGITCSAQTNTSLKVGLSPLYPSAWWRFHPAAGFLAIEGAIGLRLKGSTGGQLHRRGGHPGDLFLLGHFRLVRKVEFLSISPPSSTSIARACC